MECPSACRLSLCVFYFWKSSRGEEFLPSSFTVEIDASPCTISLVDLQLSWAQFDGTKRAAATPMCLWGKVLICLGSLVDFYSGLCGLEEWLSYEKMPRLLMKKINGLMAIDEDEKEEEENEDGQVQHNTIEDFDG